MGANLQVNGAALKFLHTRVLGVVASRHFKMGLI